MHNVSRFHSLDTLTFVEWFDMLADDKPKPVKSGLYNEDLGEEDVDCEEKVSTYVYDVMAPNEFYFNGCMQEPGFYYMRAPEEEAKQLSQSFEEEAKKLSPLCEPLLGRVRKLSFSELVFISDVFTSRVLPPDDEVRALVEKGDASKFFEKEVEAIASQGLENMRDKVWTRYFEHGIMGIVRRFFSALANFFLKYGGEEEDDSAYETDIIWPGNSCHYADQVVEQITRVKKIFLQMAFQASKEVLSNNLDLSLEEFEQAEFSDLKKRYYKKMLSLHPDKNPDEAATSQFKAVNQTWHDFVQLQQLVEKYDVELPDADEMDLKDDLESPLPAKKTWPSDLPHHFIHKYRALMPAIPIAVS